MTDSQNKKASLTNKSSSTKSLEKAQKNPISSKEKEKNKTKSVYPFVTDEIIDMDAITDVSMSEDMYDYADVKYDKVEEFAVWFGKEFNNVGTKYPALIPTNFIEVLKRDYDDKRDDLVKYQKDIFDDLIELMEEYYNEKLD